MIVIDNTIYIIFAKLNSHVEHKIIIVKFKLPHINTSKKYNIQFY